MFYKKNDDALLGRVFASTIAGFATYWLVVDIATVVTGRADLNQSIPFLVPSVLGCIAFIGWKVFGNSPDSPPEE